MEKLQSINPSNYDMRIIDLTHTFTEDMPTYPGDPKATLEQVAFIEKDSFNDHKLTFNN